MNSHRPEQLGRTDIGDRVRIDLPKEKRLDHTQSHGEIGGEYFPGIKYVLLSRDRYARYIRNSSEKISRS